MSLREFGFTTSCALHSLSDAGGSGFANSGSARSIGLEVFHKSLLDDSLRKVLSSKVKVDGLKILEPGSQVYFYSRSAKGVSRVGPATVLSRNTLTGNYHLQSPTKAIVTASPRDIELFSFETEQIETYLPGRAIMSRDIISQQTANKFERLEQGIEGLISCCLLYTSPSPRDS